MCLAACTDRIDTEYLIEDFQEIPYKFHKACFMADACTFFCIRLNYTAANITDTVIVCILMTCYFN